MTAQSTLMAKDFRYVLRVSKRSVVALIVFSFFINILMLTPLFYMMNVFDKAVSTGSFPTLISLALIAIFLYVTLAALEWVRSLVLEHIGIKMDALISPRLYQICFESESGAMGAERVGSQPLTDLNSLRQFIGSHSFTVLFDLPWVPMFVALMFFFHPSLAVVAAICMALSAGIAYVNQKLATKKLNTTSEKNRTISRHTQRNLRNAEVAMAMGIVAPLSAMWRVKQDEMLKGHMDATFVTSGFGATMRTLNMVMQSVAITTGAVLVLSQAISPGVMIAAALLLGKAIMPIQTAVSSWRSFVDAYGQYRRINSLLEQHAEKHEKMALPRIQGHVQLAGVTLTAPHSTKIILQEIFLDMRPGTATMILGASAAGKSTLLRVILGLCTPNLGYARIDGADTASYDREQLGPQLGYLPQDIELFDGSVSENIARFGGVDAEAVLQAAKDAGVHEMILSLPEGYDTLLDGSLGQLSPGQRQRIALARALYNRPALLILDEPNSNLDEHGEKALNGSIALMKDLGSTVILVSHRQTAMPFIDHVVVMDSGRIKIQGPREEIVAAARERMGQPQPPAQIVKVVAGSENSGT